MAFHKAKALLAAEKSVAQGKISHAIKQYQDILDKDPSDVSLLNTIGDLHIRERNVTEGLRQFHKLAEAYVREGFNVKAIAIYRKISKVDPNSVDTLLKLAELYQLQGLSREAREQYLQAAEFFKRRRQLDRALEALRKLVHLDPENVNFRNHLAEECEQSGKREEAAQSYLESAEILIRRGDQAGAEPALKKAAELDPRNSKIQILRARVAIACQQPQEAERIVNSAPELQADPAGKHILLDAYLGLRKAQEAKTLIGEVFQANPMDFAPVSSVSALLVEEGDIEGAYQLLASLAEPLINQNNAAALLEPLRRVWTSAPEHIPTLELVHRICERTANESILPEVLEALGRAYEHADDLEKAEADYLNLVEREPENENYHGLLKAVQQKLGRVLKPAEFPSKEMALATAEDEPPAPSATLDADQEAMVKEALENSDLFARYNLPERAISELEKVLHVYPDQIDVHRRILEISRKGYPERGSQAAAQLARIFANLGDAETASKYQAIASTNGTSQEIPLPPASPDRIIEEAVPPPRATLKGPETGALMELPIAEVAPEEPVVAEPTPPAAFPFDATPPPALPVEPEAAPSSPPEPPTELDLTGEFEALTGSGPRASATYASEPVGLPTAEIPLPIEIPPSSEELPLPPVAEMEAPHMEAPALASVPPPAPAGGTASADLEECKIEVEFYLENGFVEEARQVVTGLEAEYPGSPYVATLRQRLDKQAAGAASAQPPAEVTTESAALPAAFESAADANPAKQQKEAAQARSDVDSLSASTLIADELGSEEWELPTRYATPLPEPPTHAVVPPPAAPPESSPTTRSSAIEGRTAVDNGGSDMLTDLAGDLASSIDRLAPSPGARSTSPPPPSATPAQGVEQLSSLLTEMEEPRVAATAKDDPETHYNLGVAFREMGLLDEAIGEFQKVVKDAGKGNFPPNYLQACSLLAICFMEKKMPAIAVKWYLRALETPSLDNEAELALQYDLGQAYEQAGDVRKALERYTEVYSQNIDFRDVADKIREHQQNA